MKSTPLLRRARMEEAELLTGIAQAGKQHWGYPAAWLAAWRYDLTLSREYIRTQPVFVAEVDGVVVGFVGLELTKEGNRLEHLWLRPAWIGRGLGRLLFAEAVAQARQAGVTDLRIDADPNAEGFYLKMGARRIGTEVYELPGNIRREIPQLGFKL